MILGKKLVVVLPAYNAELTLRKTYGEVPFDIVDDVVLVDDASHDRTLEVAKEIGIKHIIRHEINKGYGGNQKSCYDKALGLDGDIIIMLHPDYQYTPRLIHSMAYLIANDVYPVVLGSRILGKGALKGGMPLYKYVFNRCLTLAQNILINQKLSEYHTGYRAFSRLVLETVDYHANSDDFVFDNQMLSQIVFAGFEIAEMTCPTKYFAEASSINFWRSLKYGIGCIRVSLEHLLSKRGIIKRAIYGKSRERRSERNLRLVSVLSAIILAFAGLGIFLAAKRPAPAARQCSHTDYGFGVTCISGAGRGGDEPDMTSRTVLYRPTAGHAIVAAAYTCADKDCQHVPHTTLAISDNINNPERCFKASPHSPFALNETSAGKQKLQEYIWMCPSIPSNVSEFTITCSAPGSCSYLALTASEWTGLATSDVFDTDGGAASKTQQTVATITTSLPTRYTKDLLYTFLDNTRDLIMTPSPPYRTVLQFYSGNINTATTAGTSGVQTAITTWKGDDDWYGAIAAIKSAASTPAPISDR